MKKSIYILAAAIVPFTVLSCNKSDKTPGTPVPEGKINIATSIEGLSKSPVLDDNGKGSFSNGDTFTLLVTNSEGESSAFSYTVGTTDLYWKDITIPAGNGQYGFSACYPSVETGNGTFTFDLTAASDKDLLIAGVQGIEAETENPVNLTFRHAMHRLVVTFSSDSELKDVTTVCSAISSCQVNLPEGTIEAGSAKSEFTESGTEATFLLVPQNTSEVTLDVTIDGNTSSFQLNELKPDLEMLEGGMQLTVELTVKDSKITVGNIAIEGWGDQGTAEGEIIL